MAAMTIRGKSEAHISYTGTSLSIARPSAPAAPLSGDTMLARIGAKEVAATITAPAGWTLVDSSPATVGYDVPEVRVWVFAKDAGGSEPASYVFTSDMATGLEGQIVAYEGTATVNVYDSNADINPGTASFELPSLTTTQPACTIVYMTATWEYPPTAPNRTVDAITAGTLQDTNTGFQVSGAFADLEAAVAGTYGGVSMETPQSTLFACVALALLPGATPVAVIVTPATANVVVNATKQFSATVENAVDTTVTWSVVGGGAGGTIDGTGLYTAPAAVGSGSDTVRATANEDGTTYDEAVVTVLASGTTVPVRLVFRRRGV